MRFTEGGENVNDSRGAAADRIFLTAQMIEALQAVEYELPSFDAEPREVQLADAARSRVQVRHVRGASDATYLINSFNDELLMQLQLNVHRLVVVSRTRTRCTRRSVSSVGALAPSTPDGNSAGVMHRLQVMPPGAT